MKFEDKVALITGAASGIGRSMARCFAAEGATVVAVDIDGDRLAKVAEELSCEAVVADLATAEGVAAVTGRDRVDILCNNAGILDALTPLLEVDDAMWDRVMGLLSVCLQSRALRPFWWMPASRIGIAIWERG